MILKYYKELVDPFSHIDTVGVMEKDKKIAITAIKHYRQMGNFRHINDKVRQSLVNIIFSSRNLKKVIGNTYTKKDIEYFGFTTKMTPSKLLVLASERREGRFQTKNGEAFSAFLEKKINTFFDGDREAGMPKEGRHRAEAIRRLFHINVKIPVDIVFAEGVRKSSLPKEILNSKIETQDGRYTQYTLQSLRRES